jgi:hypothetical protein
MKRIALLVATVLSGAGCVVDTCDPETLKVTWSFGGASCATAGVNNVDVYVDGAVVANAVPCTDYGGTVANLGSGYHDVIVEGFNGSSIVSRDWATVNVASCGQTRFDALPGNGVIEFLPTTCSAAGHFLTYDLWDDTRPTSYRIDADLPGTGWSALYTCGVGYSVNVPFGYYSLRGMEEVDSTALTVYNTHCGTIPGSVLGPGTSSYGVAWTGVAACF